MLYTPRPSSAGISYSTSGCFGETAPGFDEACHRKNLDSMHKMVPADRLAASVGAVRSRRHAAHTHTFEHHIRIRSYVLNLVCVY